MLQVLMAFLEKPSSPERQAEDVRHGKWKLPSIRSALFLSLYVGPKGQERLDFGVIDLKR